MSRPNLAVTCQAAALLLVLKLLVPTIATMVVMLVEEARAMPRAMLVLNLASEQRYVSF